MVHFMTAIFTTLLSGGFSPSGGPSGKGGQNRENPTRSGDITCMLIPVHCQTVSAGTAPSLREKWIFDGACLHTFSPNGLWQSRKQSESILNF